LQPQAKAAGNAHQQKRRRCQNALAQEKIELAFVTPSGLAACYRRQETQVIYDDGLADMLQGWIRGEQRKDKSHLN